MTRAQAERLVAKLDALADPARGGTPNEQHVARQKAQALRSKYDLTATPPRPRAQRDPRAPRRRPVYTAPTTGPAWTFNTKTQQHTPNVKVHHYKDHANWRIEITDW